MRSKKTFLFALLLAFVVLLAGCSKTEDTVTAPEGTVALFKADGTTDYVIVCAEGDNTAALALQKAIRTAGGAIDLVTDSVTDAQNEIVIGITNREASTRAAEGLQNNQYRFLYEDGKVVIVGGSDDALTKGVAAFADSYLKADTKGLLFVPEALHITAQNAVETVFPTTDYVIADIIATEAPYNADPTGVEDVTAVLQQALDDCAAMGGGTVWLPVGTYRVTGTVTIPSKVTLRGDRRDPDTGSGDYGTVISADVTQNIERLFYMSHSSGARGLTIYYPHQTIENPQDFGWAFETIGGHGPYIGEITLLNAYKGLGLSAPPYTEIANSNMYIYNIKGTALSEGMTVYNNAGACSYEEIHFHNRYWAEAGEAYNAPSLEALNAYTRQNGIAFTFGDMEMPLIYKLSADEYKYGIWCAKGSRLDFWGAGMTELDIRNTDVAIYAENILKGRMFGVVNSTLEGSEASIWNASELGEIWATGCTLEGTAIAVHVKKNIEVGTYPALTEDRKAAKGVIYNVTQAPYNAPCAPINQDGDLGGDCTSAIQQALNDAGMAGGGIVYLPAGHYSVYGNLTVPAGVELRGSGSIPSVSGVAGGTTVFLYAGKNSTDPDNETAGITLVGDGAGLRYIKLFYPENPFATKGSLVEYPYAVRIAGAKNAYCVDVHFSNPCRGLDIADGSDGHYVKRISGTAAYNFVRVGKTSEGRIETLHDINPTYWPTASTYGITTPWMGDVFEHFVSFQKNNCDCIIINGAENEYILDVIQYGGRNLIILNDGNVTAWSVLLDQGGKYCIRAKGGNITVYNSEMTGGGTKINYEDGGSITAYNVLYNRGFY